MNNPYLIIELLYHKNKGFEVECGFTDDDKKNVKRICKYVGLFPT